MSGSGWVTSGLGDDSSQKTVLEIGVARSTRPRSDHPGGWGAEITGASCPRPDREATMSLCPAIAAAPRLTSARIMT